MCRVPIICPTQKCNKQGVSKIRLTWALMRAQAEQEREDQCAFPIIPLSTSLGSKYLLPGPGNSSSLLLLRLGIGPRGIEFLLFLFLLLKTLHLEKLPSQPNQN